MNRFLIYIIVMILFTSLYSIQITRHSINVKLDPAKHYLKATDTIEYAEKLTTPDTLYLPSNLKIKAFKSLNKKIEYQFD